MENGAVMPEVISSIPEIGFEYVRFIDLGIPESPFNLACAIFKAAPEMSMTVKSLYPDLQQIVHQCGCAPADIDDSGGSG